MAAGAARIVHVVKLSRKVLYELDGGDREKKKTFRVDVQPGAVSVCVPAGRRLLA